MFVQSEVSYDDYHSNKENLYRIGLDRIYPDHISLYAITPASIGPQAYQDFPEVTSFVRIWKSNNDVAIQYEEKNYLEPRVMAADSNFYEVFEIKLIKGDPKKVFEIPNAVVLTESTAFKYFGNEDPIRKNIARCFWKLNCNRDKRGCS